MLTLKQIPIAQHSEIRYVAHMKITKKIYKKIEPLLPVQRGNVVITNRRFLEAILYMLENGCKWRSLPKKFGNWATIYKRFRRWTEAGVFQKVLEVIQNERFENIDISALSLDSTFVKVSPNASGAFKKKDRKQ